MVAKIIRLITNRFVLVTLAFLAWVLFFDRNDLINQRQKTLELNELQAKITYYQTEIKHMEGQLQALQNDPSTLEKYAREKYFMKRVNEDVFIFDK